MDSLDKFSGHLLFLCVPLWGHLRPLCALAAKAVQVRSDVVVTLLICGDYLKRTEQEVNKFFSSSEADSCAKENIRIVNFCKEVISDHLKQIALMPRDFPGYYDNLINCKPLLCLQTKRTFDAVRKPTAVVLDPFLLSNLRYIRSVSGKSIPVFAWVTSCVSASLQFLGPEKLGGVGDVASKARTQAEATGGNYEDIIERLCRPSDGNVVKVPGLPSMYDYEFHPQEYSEDHPAGDFFVIGYTFARECDGFVCVTSAAYESESLDAMRSWLGETNRSLYPVGPLIHPGSWDATLSDKLRQIEIESSKNVGEVQDFLDKILKTHGEKSVLYISFGTFWFPPRIEHLWALVDVLLELNFPFIMSCASPNAVILPEYAEKIKQSGIGFLSTWCPQLTIFNHPATGWFLTHCGHNSVTEALAQGIPMLAWPLKVDQPASAAHLTFNLDVAFQMVEFRTGGGLRPLYSGARPTGTIDAVKAEARDILKRARGPEGERKRRNAVSMGYKWKKEWEEGGDSLINLRKFLTDHGSRS